MPGIDFAQLLVTTVERNASDLHLTVDDPPMVRIHGDIQPMDAEAKPLQREELHMLLYDVLSEEQRKRLERDKELDFALELKNVGRFRVNIFHTRRGEGAAFRYIPNVIKSFADINVPEQTLKDICNRKKGLVLVTGPTGSGKSTTLAAMVDYVNQTRSDHIITIEDPIEFIHDHKKCIVNQREVGSHTHSFANALRSALREDPDIILVGEMRDLETISLALTAAETGHLVFATLHTMSAPKTVDRVIDVFPPEQQQQIRIMFSEAILAVVSQALLKKRDGNGRIPAFEIMIATTAIRSLIRESKTHQISTIIQTSQKIGMQSLDQHLKSLVMLRKVDMKEALPYAAHPALFEGHATDSA
jgi:twitching motility protein PilT